MKYTKLNTNWNADPNNPEPTILLIDNGIELSFVLNPTAYEHIDNDEIGSLKFQNVFAYRLESTNNEEDVRDQFRFKNDQLPWGEFYELINSKWESNFPNNKFVVNQSINKKEIRHFVFFLGNTIFECLATDYQFNYKNNIIDILDEKYPKGYLNHYISMFTSQFSKPTIENFKIYTDLYIQMESKKEFVDLKNELKNIKKNNDLNLYLKFANRFEIVGFGIKQLDDMIKVIENHNI